MLRREAVSAPKVTLLHQLSVMRSREKPHCGYLHLDAMLMVEGDGDRAAERDVGRPMIIQESSSLRGRLVSAEDAMVCCAVL